MDDLELQAMIHYIAWDRLIGTLENYPLAMRGAQGLADQVPTIKSFAHLMQDFAGAQFPNEHYDELYSKANQVVSGLITQANRPMGK